MYTLHFNGRTIDLEEEADKKYSEYMKVLSESMYDYTVEKSKAISAFIHNKRGIVYLRGNMYIHELIFEDTEAGIKINLREQLELLYLINNNHCERIDFIFDLFKDGGIAIEALYFTKTRHKGIQCTDIYGIYSNIKEKEPCSITITAKDKDTLETKSSIQVDLPFNDIKTDDCEHNKYDNGIEVYRFVKSDKYPGCKLSQVKFNGHTVQTAISDFFAYNCIYEIKCNDYTFTVFEEQKIEKVGHTKTIMHKNHERMLNLRLNNYNITAQVFKQRSRQGQSALVMVFEESAFYGVYMLDNLIVKAISNMGYEHNLLVNILKDRIEQNKRFYYNKHSFED